MPQSGILLPTLKSLSGFSPYQSHKTHTPSGTGWKALDDDPIPEGKILLLTHAAFHYKYGNILTAGVFIYDGSTNYGYLQVIPDISSKTTYTTQYNLWIKPGQYVRFYVNVSTASPTLYLSINGCLFDYNEV
jgi:hypothetical protein